jgi:hypothetical protein
MLLLLSILLLLVFPAVVVWGSALYSPSSNSVYIYYPSTAHLLLLPLSNSHFTTRNITKATTSLPVPAVISPGDVYVPLLIPHHSGGDEFYLLGACSAGDEISLYGLSADAHKPRWDSHPLAKRPGMKEHAGAFVDDGKLYLFGGLENVTLSAAMVEIEVAANAVKTRDEAAGGKWIVPTAGFALAPLPGRRVAMVGGFDEKDLFLMEEVPVLSLQDMVWGLHAVAAPPEGVEISPRVGHSAVVTADGRKLLVFGGWQEDSKTPATPPFVVLDMSTDPWRWEVPEHQPEKSHWGHGAVMLPGDVMLVTGGQVRAGPSQPKEDNRGVLLYSVAEKRWVDSYPPRGPETRRKGTAPSPSPAPEDPEEKKLSSGAVAGIAIGVSLGILAIIGGIATSCVHRRRRSRAAVAAAKRMTLLNEGEDGDETRTAPKSQLRPSNPTSRVPSLDLSDESDEYTPRRRLSDVTRASNPFDKEEYELPELRSADADALQTRAVTRPPTPVPSRPAFSRAGSSNMVLRRHERDSLSEHSVEVGVPVTMQVLKGRVQVVEVGSQASVRGSIMGDGDEVEEGHGDKLTRWKTANEGSERLMDFGADSGNEAEQGNADGKKIKGKRG